MLTLPLVVLLAAAPTTPLPRPFPTPAAEGVLAVNGVELAFARWGEGEPVVLLHGGAGTLTHWGGQVPALAERFHVIALDLRGHGRSTRGEAPFSYALLAADVEAALEQLGLATVQVIGWSDGGIVALELARKNPKRVRGLVLYGVNFDATGGQKGTSPAVKTYFQRCREDYAQRSTTPTDFDGLLGALRPMWRTQPRWTLADLKALDVPTLVLRGEHDELIKAGHVKTLAATLPRATLVDLKGVSHFAPWQDPQAFSEAALKFLTRAP